MKRYRLLTASVLLSAAVLACPVTAREEAAGTETADQNDDAAEGKVAKTSEMTDVEDVLEDWMIPIPAADIADGTYDVDVNCSSSMFPIEEALLTVQNGEAWATLTMGGTGYLYVYPGTGLEAANAPREDYIPYEEAEDGRHTFTIPVEGLDQAIPLAAFSRNKEKWYDRSLVFVSTSLPGDAVEGSVQTVTAEDLGLADGEYLVEAERFGGSGRASIESPARLTIQDGKPVLEVIFSSPHYDYMLVDGEKYEPVNMEGNSTFLIPAPGFDALFPVVADTTAMSKPHEIDYAILLNSGSLQEAD